MKFASNSLLEDFLSEVRINGDHLERAVHIAISAHEFKKGTPINSITGPAAEIIVKFSNREVPGFEKHITWDPIKPPARAGGYVFKPGLKGLKIDLVYPETSRTGQLITDCPDIDDLALFYNLPVIMEVKVRKRFAGGQNVKKSSVRASLDPKIAEIKSFPIARYFRHKPGYVAIIPPEFFRNKDHIAKLKAEGGHAIPFYTSADPFKKEVKEVLDSLGFEYEDNRV